MHDDCLCFFFLYRLSTLVLWHRNSYAIWKGEIWHKLYRSRTWTTDMVGWYLRKFYPPSQVNVSSWLFTYLFILMLVFHFFCYFTSSHVSSNNYGPSEWSGPQSLEELWISSLLHCSWGINSLVMNATAWGWRFAFNTFFLFFPQSCNKQYIGFLGMLSLEHFSSFFLFL